MQYSPQSDCKSARNQREPKSSPIAEFQDETRSIFGVGSNVFHPAPNQKTRRIRIRESGRPPNVKRRKQTEWNPTPYAFCVGVWRTGAAAPRAEVDRAPTFLLDPFQFSKTSQLANKQTVAENTAISPAFSKVASQEDFLLPSTGAHAL
jgi:hypothetical protein